MLEQHLAGFERAWQKKDSYLGEKQGKKHRKNGLLIYWIEIGSFLTKSFLIFFFYMWISPSNVINGIHRQN